MIEMLQALQNAKAHFEAAADGWKLSYTGLREHLGEMRIWLCIYRADSQNASYGFHMSERGLFINNTALLGDPQAKPAYAALEAALGMEIRNKENA